MLAHHIFLQKFVGTLLANCKHCWQKSLGQRRPNLLGQPRADGQNFIGPTSFANVGPTMLLTESQRWPNTWMLSGVPLPIKLRTKRAVINIQNKDNKCFMWSLLAALHPCHRHSERICKYRDYSNELNFDGISFPVKMADIPKFEKQNEISVNVFGYEKYEIFPVHITKNRYERHIKLLLLSDQKKNHISAGSKTWTDYYSIRKAVKISIITVPTAYTYSPKKGYRRIMSHTARSMDHRKSNFHQKKTNSCYIKTYANS